MTGQQNESWLDATVRDARRRGAWMVPGEVKLNKLQDPFLEDGRFELRLAEGVTVVENAWVLGSDRRVCFVFDSLRHNWRIAVDLVPAGMDHLIEARTLHYGILSGGDVDALVHFRGKDIMRNGLDCQCVFARLAERLFTDAGFGHTEVQANRAARVWDLDRNGVTSIPVPWMNEEGDNLTRYVRVRCHTRRFRRRQLAA